MLSAINGYEIFIHGMLLFDRRRFFFSFFLLFYFVLILESPYAKFFFIEWVINECN